MLQIINIRVISCAVREPSVMGTEFSDTDLEWVEFDERALLPSSSDSATLSFECLQIEGEGSAIPHCNSYFDSFELRVVYPLY